MSKYLKKEPVHMSFTMRKRESSKAHIIKGAIIVLFMVALVAMYIYMIMRGN